MPMQLRKSDTVGNEILSLFSDVSHAQTVRAHVPQRASVYEAMMQIVAQKQVERDSIASLAERELMAIGRSGLDAYFAENISIEAQQQANESVDNAKSQLFDFLSSMKGTKLQINFKNQPTQVGLVHRFSGREVEILENNQVAGVINERTFESTPPSIDLGLIGLRAMFDRSAHYSVPIIDAATYEPTAHIAVLGA